MILRCISKLSSFRAPTSFNLSTPCGTNKFLEIEYVCCGKDTKDHDIFIEDHRLVSSSVHKTALAFLKEYSTVNRQFDTIFSGLESSLKKIENQFQLSDLPPPPQITPMIRSYLMSWIGANSLNLNTAPHKQLILSRRTQWHDMTIQLHNLAQERSYHLFLMAFVVATDEEQSKNMKKLKPEDLSVISSLRQYDVDQILERFEHTNALDVTVFPELKPQIESTWIDNCVNHTWGIPENDLRNIFNSSHAHSQILHKYHKIFAEAAKDEFVTQSSQSVSSPFEPNHISETTVIAFVVTITLLFVIVVFKVIIRCEFCVSKVKNFKSEKVDHFVRFGREEDAQSGVAHVEMSQNFQ
ncbi:hypothetical protein L596_027386 [Steinernema carpocapsae]|uniref:Uncharacterized protein n=1 Tax=Steinernema carpocapsae TaxID=34508 RepID=A0A4U5M469_STECR|nr:hypothetical protein L596_027386 [Steinernema carpocapsae]